MESNGDKLLGKEFFSKVSAKDFTIEQVIDASEHRVTVGARVSAGGQLSSCLYTVQLVVTAHPQCEIETQMIPELPPINGLAKLRAHFVSSVPEPFFQLLPLQAQTATDGTKQDDSVEIIGHFFVYDFYPQTLNGWLFKKTFPLRFEVALKLAERILKIIEFLEENCVCHLELAMERVFMTEDNQIVIGLDHAVKFEDHTFQLAHEQVDLLDRRACSDHAAPEVLNRLHECQRDTTTADEGVNCSSQASFGAGVLISKVCTGRHPLADYPLHYTNGSGLVSFTKDDILQFPGIYPKSFHSILQDLLACDPQRRLSIGEALNQLRVCCMPRRNSVGASDTPELRRVREKRDELRTKLKAACAERDAALAEIDVLRTQRDSVITERDEAMLERNEAVHQRDTALLQKEDALSELQAVISKRDEASDERDALLSERDSSASDTDDEDEEGTNKNFLPETENSVSEIEHDGTIDDGDPIHADGIITQANLEEVISERDEARVQRDTAIAERDLAVSELERVSDQCANTVGEFQSMADHSELLLKEIEQLRVDRDSAVQASQSAYRATELLREQLALITRERDLAQSQVKELQEMAKKTRLEEQVVDCTCCHTFFLESQNTPTSCNWHTGVSL